MFFTHWSQALVQGLSRLTLRGGKRPGGRGNIVAFRPAVDALEDRALPSTLGSELMFNPQPEPPKAAVATSAARLPGGELMFNPQPEPPRDTVATVVENAR